MRINLQTPNIDCSLFLLQFHVTEKLLCQPSDVLLLANPMEAMSDTATEEVWKSISTMIEMEMAEVSARTGWQGAQRKNDGSEGSMKQAGSPGRAALPDPCISDPSYGNSGCTEVRVTPNTFGRIM